MSMQKIGTLVLYAAMVVVMFSLQGSTMATVIAWVFVVLAVAHLAEFFLVLSLLKSAPGSMGGHFVQTMLFGFMHWMPIKKSME